MKRFRISLMVQLAQTSLRSKVKKVSSKVITSLFRSLSQILKSTQKEQMQGGGTCEHFMLVPPLEGGDGFFLSPNAIRSSTDDGYHGAVLAFLLFMAILSLSLGSALEGSMAFCMYPDELYVQLDCYLRTYKLSTFVLWMCYHPEKRRHTCLLYSYLPS